MLNVFGNKFTKILRWIIGFMEQKWGEVIVWEAIVKKNWENEEQDESMVGGGAEKEIET